MLVRQQISRNSSKSIMRSKTQEVTQSEPRTDGPAKEVMKRSFAEE